MAYLDVAKFKLRSVMPSEDIDDLEARAPGWLAATLIAEQSKMDAQFRKRYAAPFADPSETVLGWLTSIVTFKAYVKRGTNPQDPTVVLIKGEHDDAKKEIALAADSVTGLYDLPLREDGTDNSGVVKGAPLSYSEQSPYRAFDLQRSTARTEDGQR